MDLITRRIIAGREQEVTNDILSEYADPDSERYRVMLDEIRKELILRH
jgi:amidophosphoribosyltransferase